MRLIARCQQSVSEGFQREQLGFPKGANWISQGGKLDFQREQIGLLGKASLVGALSYTDVANPIFS